MGGRSDLGVGGPRDGGGGLGGGGQGGWEGGGKRTAFGYRGCAGQRLYES